MNKTVYGQGNECYLFGPVTVANTVARVSTILDLSDKDMLSLILLAAGGAATLDGAWKIEVSDDYVGPASAAAYGAVAHAGTWVDISASAIWVDAIAAVLHGTAASTKQYMQPKYPIGARALRVTFTGTTGSATVAVIAFAKSFSG